MTGDRADAGTPRSGSDTSGAASGGGSVALRVRCESCGPRIVALSSVRLLGRSGRWEYVFTCPDCKARVRRSADAALRAALRGAGVAELSSPDGDRAP